MRICVIGTGYVGLVAGACFADSGNHVICVDINETKIEGLRAGVMPIYEPGLRDVVMRNHAAGRLAFSTDLADAVRASRVVFIAVGTPQGEDGSADLQYVFAAASAIGAEIDDFKVVVNKSTVPVGTVDAIEARMRPLAKADFAVASNPEFLKEGAAVQDFQKPDRIIVGTRDARGEQILRELYAPFNRTEDRLFVTDPRSAEMTKYAANAMLATRISFMNEVARLCDALGADVEFVRQGIGSDPRIGRKFLFPGVGFGGSCFPKDLAALVRMGRDHGAPMGILEAVVAANERQKHRIVEKVVEHFGEDLRGRTFALWGLAFKPGTDDMREAPSAVIAAELVARGADVRATDPIAIETARPVLPSAVTFHADAYEAAEGADAVVLVTEWPAYRTPDFEQLARRLRTPVVFDGRNLYDPQGMAQRGFIHYAIGRPSVPPVVRG
jgi:UDPglucose 6-dehydrogenase